MTTIRLTFTAGRYHATPWGRHVNEGVAEWPPSPYRLFRGLYDVWQRKCPDLREAEVAELLEKLAAQPPRFRLPSASATHTRSYLSANTTDPTDKSLVFDSFLTFAPPAACFVSWPGLDLSGRERTTLQRLLAQLNYLGRSESWIEADLLDRETSVEFNCDVTGTTGAMGELTRVACALPATEYEGRGTWLNALTFSTTNLIKERASSPPLLRQIAYVRPENAIETDPPYRRSEAFQSVQEILLGLDSTVLPLATGTIEVAEQIRVRLMGAHKSRMGPDQISPLFSGKTADGSMRLDHGHVYILPLSRKEDSRIDRVLLISRMQHFQPDELDAVRGVRKLWQRDGRPDVRCVVTWQGAIGEGVGERTAVVVSATPFVPPRHWHKGRDFREFLFDEVRRECRNHRLPEPLKVEAAARMRGIFHESEYRRNRKGDPVRPGFSLRLTFSQEVVAPFAIGYGAHYGLGQFCAE